MKYICILLFVVLCIGCAIQKQIIQDPDSLFITLQKHNYPNKKICNRYIKMYKKERKKVYPRLDFINYDKDTVYIMQKVNVESWTFHESIWNKKGKVEYSSFGDELKTNLKHGAFTEEYYPLINKWVIDSIKYYDKKYGDYVYPTYIRAIKIIINDGELNTECINFREFAHPNENRKFID